MKPFNKQTIFYLAITSIAALLFAPQTFARPEYAAREKMNCVNCHWAPIGGGPRKVSGKIWGTRNIEGSLSADKGNYYADFRGLYLKDAEKSNQENFHGTGNGLGLMTALGAVKVPVSERLEGYKTELVLTYDFGNFGPGPREEYVLFTDYQAKWWQPTNIMLGKFYSPFGLLSDEHRTYTRFQTATTLREYEVGTVLSFDPLYYLHFDLALTDGLGFEGESRLDGNDTYGTISNIRLNHPDLPFMVGGSYSNHGTKQEDKGNPYAYSAYGVINFDKLIHQKFVANLNLEAVWAKYLNGDSFNSRYIQSFVPNSTVGQNYKDEIAGKKSRGFVADFKWEVTPTFILQYKFDHLILDDRFEGDSFSRNGVGFRYQFGSNTNLLVRYEWADVDVPELGDAPIRSTQDTLYAVYRLWL